MTGNLEHPNRTGELAYPQCSDIEHPLGTRPAESVLLEPNSVSDMNIPSA